MVHPHLERLRRMLSTSEIQRREVEAKLADAEAKLEESKFVIASLQTSKATLQNTLNQSIQETDYCKQARLAFEEEITILRQKKEVERYWKRTRNWQKRIQLANNTSTKRKIACFGHSNGRRRMLTLQFWRERSLFGEQQGKNKQEDQAIDRPKIRVNQF